MIAGILAAALVATVPLALAALGGAVQQRSGIVNIALEGQMLVGALFGAIASGVLRSWLAGAVAGALAGALVGLLFTVFVTRLHANEIIAGLGLNIVAAGVIAFVLRAAIGVSGTLQVPGLQELPNVVVPGVTAIPFIGPILDAQTPLFWATVVLVPLLAWLLRNTAWGIRLRATGATEPAARSLGIRTSATRESAGMIAGALAGLGGVALSLGAVGLFSENMTGGRGYVALAAFYFGRSRPFPTALACLLFGFFEALQIQLQTRSTGSASLLATLPYIAVIVALTISGVRAARSRSRRVV